MKLFPLVIALAAALSMTQSYAADTSTPKAEVKTPPVDSNQASSKRITHTNKSSGLAVGVQAGAGFGSLAQSGSTYSTRTGPAFGLSFDYAIDETFSVNPELNYIQKGAKTLSLGGTNLTYKLDRLEIPILVKAKFDVPVVRPYVFAGPSVGFLVKNTLGADTGTPTNIAAKTIEIAIQGGAGGEMAITKSLNIYLNARYILGLTDQFVTVGTNAKSNVFLALAGVEFTNLEIF